LAFYGNQAITQLVLGDRLVIDDGDYAIDGNGLAGRLRRSERRHQHGKQCEK
jgi:hypothetical protein